MAVSEFIQNLGVLVSLWFLARNYHKDSRDTQLSNLLTVSDRGDALFAEVKKDPKLKRILAFDADISEPPTIEEEEYLIRIFKLFQNGWRVACATDRAALNELGYDIADFLKRPLAGVFWEKEQAFKNKKFVRFVKRAIEVARQAEIIEPSQNH